MRRLQCGECFEWFDLRAGASIRWICSPECEEKKRQRIAARDVMLREVAQRERAVALKRRDERNEARALRRIPKPPRVIPLPSPKVGLSKKSRRKLRRKRLLSEIDRLNQEIRSLKAGHPPVVTKLWRPKHPFYDSDEWLKLKYRALRTYGRRCSACHKTEGEMHVDHIKPRSKYPELALEFSNLQILCRDCNLGKSNLDETDWRTPPG